MKLVWSFSDMSTFESKVFKPFEFMQVAKEIGKVEFDGVEYKLGSIHLIGDEDPYLQIWVDEIN